MKTFLFYFVKWLILVALIFIANAFLDCLNAKDWMQFIVGLVALPLLAFAGYKTITFKGFRK